MPVFNLIMMMITMIMMARIAVMMMIIMVRMAMMMVKRKKLTVCSGVKQMLIVGKTSSPTRPVDTS